MAKNDIYMREQGRGGNLTDVRNPGSIPIAGKSEVVLLIHGYNNTEGAARESYRDFVRNVNAHALRPILDDDDGVGHIPVFKVFWPGDWNVNVAVSSLSYPQMVHRAPRVADKLEAFLNDLSGPGGGPMQIHIVAHSLGSRVTGELVNYLKNRNQRGNHTVVSFTLMAAAIPEKMVSGGHLSFLAWETGIKKQVLHSRNDKVLFLAFPAGQTAAGEGFFPTAVGRNGQPGWAWEYVEDFGEFDYDHGDYWSGKQAAQQASRLFGNPVYVEKTRVIPTHGLPESREIGVRVMERRRIGR